MTVRAPDVGNALTLDTAAAMAAPEVLANLDSQIEGLSASEAAARLARVGPNQLDEHRVHASAVLARQLRNPLLLLLLGAAVVSGLTGGGTNAIIIAVIVALSVGLGFFNEYSAEVAMAALRSKISHVTTVRRDGRLTDVEVIDLVPGDVVTLRLGALVPADLRLLDVDELECDEGVLTGESLPIEKVSAPVSQAGDTSNSAFMGTVVHQGSGVGVVVATAARTAFGQIAAGSPSGRAGRHSRRGSRASRGSSSSWRPCSPWASSRSTSPFRGPWWTLCSSPWPSPWASPPR